jgi:hypothetical protein
MPEAIRALSHFGTGRVAGRGNAQYGSRTDFKSSQ